VKYAKLRFSVAEDGAGIAKCDLLLDRISLLNSMVAEYCTLIPSLAQLDNIDAVRYEAVLLEVSILRADLP
jgi:hypothetical protein